MSCTPISDRLCFINSFCQPQCPSILLIFYARRWILHSSGRELQWLSDWNTETLGWWCLQWSRTIGNLDPDYTNYSDLKLLELSRNQFSLISHISASHLTWQPNNHCVRTTALLKKVMKTWFVSSLDQLRFPITMTTSRIFPLYFSNIVFLL